MTGVSRRLRGMPLVDLRPFLFETWSVVTAAHLDRTVEARAESGAPHPANTPEAPVSSGTTVDAADTNLVEPNQVEEFMGRVISIYTGSMQTYMIDIGHRTGLFAAAAAGPATS